MLPALFILGGFTYIRLLENSIQDVLFARSIQRIRRYYLRLHPDAAEFFGDALEDSKTSPVMYNSWVQLLFTAAAMIAAINSILGGAGVALLLRELDLVGEGAAAVVGVLVAMGLFAGHIWYESRRFSQLVSGPTAADQGSASSRQLRD